MSITKRMARKSIILRRIHGMEPGQTTLSNRISFITAGRVLRTLNTLAASGRSMEKAPPRISAQVSPRRWSRKRLRRFITALRLPPVPCSLARCLRTMRATREHNCAYRMGKRTSLVSGFRLPCHIASNAPPIPRRLCSRMSFGLATFWSGTTFLTLRPCIEGGSTLERFG